MKKVINLLKKNTLNFFTGAQEMDTKCQNCGYTKAIRVYDDLRADFDLSTMEEELRSIFGKRKNGYCVRCGLYQDYLKLNIEQQRKFCVLMGSKDNSVSEEVYRKFPVPTEFIENFEKGMYEKRLVKWQEYLKKNNISPKKCLFLRPNFGAAPLLVSKLFPNCQLDFLEISDICAKTCQERIPKIKKLEGQIHGYYEGEFLKERNYDLIFNFHTMVHSIDIHDMLSKLKKMLSVNGRIIFTHEIQVKTHNPFHMIYPSEWNLEAMIKQHFTQIDRINDCDINNVPHINNYTKHKDSPDLVAYN